MAIRRKRSLREPTLSGWQNEDEVPKKAAMKIDFAMLKKLEAAGASAKVLIAYLRYEEERQKLTEHLAEMPSEADVVDEDPLARLFRLGKTILISFGVAERQTGALIGRWLKTNPDPVGLLAAIEFARERNVAEPVAYISTALAKKRGANGKTDAAQVAFDLADEIRQRESEAGIGREDDAF